MQTLTTESSAALRPREKSDERSSRKRTGSHLLLRGAAAASLSTGAHVALAQECRICHWIPHLWAAFEGARLPSGCHTLSAAALSRAGIKCEDASRNLLVSLPACTSVLVRPSMAVAMEEHDEEHGVASQSGAQNGVPSDMNLCWVMCGCMRAVTSPQPCAVRCPQLRMLQVRCCSSCTWQQSCQREPSLLGWTPIPLHIQTWQ